MFAPVSTPVSGSGSAPVSTSVSGKTGKADKAIVLIPEVKLASSNFFNVASSKSLTFESTSAA